LTKSKVVKRLFVGLLSMLLCSTTAFSIGNVRFRQYTSQDGLSQNSVWAFKQDSYGFMWVGTADGLNRFDGYNFMVYKPTPGDSTSICGSSVRSICETSNGELWISTRSGLCRYNRAANDFTNFPSFGDSDKGPISDALTDIKEDKEGNLWIGTLESGISILNLKTLKFTHIIHKDTDVEGALSGNDARGFSIGLDGHVWINTWSHGVNEYDPGTKKFKWFTHESGMLPIPYIRGGICAASNGKIYIGTWGKGIRVWDPKTKSMSDLSVGDNPLDARGMIWNITEDQKGRLWCATAETGLVMFDLATGERKNFINNINDPNSINDNNVWSVGVDRTNHIWAGTWQGGINVLNERISSFVHYRYNPFDSTALPSKSVWSFCEDGKGGLWIGTGAGPSHYNAEKDIIDFRVGAQPNDDEPNDRSTIQALARDKEGLIWMGTVGAGLYKYNPETRKYKLYHPDYEKSGLAGTIIYSLICDNDGVVWVGTSNKLQRYDRETDTFATFKNPGKDSATRTIFITQVREKDDDELYLTYSNGMVCTFNKPNEKMEIIWNKPDIEIACAVPDKRGGLWVGTSEGMYYLINGTETQFTEATGLPNNSVNAILFDEDEVMWIATNGGLCKMDPLTKELRVYRQQDGTQGNEFNQNAFFRNSDGRLWFGGTNGITAFYPEDITVNQTPADAVITSFSVLNDPYPMKEHITVAKKIELSWRDYFFSFEYSGMEFTNSSKNEYKYMMEGFDEEWVEAGTRRYVTYTNLDPGTYTFKVMASNNDGVWNGKTAEVIVIINPPFWRTTWFYILCGVALIAGTWLFIRQRERNLRKEKEVLESRVEERTAELTEEKEKVSAAHKDIRDSINYAKRIQDAILPSDSELKTLLPDSFVLYIPRDVVSGDFYWLAKPEEKNPNEILVAAADCTGHGVPGGFMSMIGNTLLNEAVRQKNEKEPALILNRLHKDIRTALHQDAGSETRDGMDVALVRLDFANGKVHYAGANRPMVMVNDGELKEIRANKMPIGGLQGEEERNFTGHAFDVKKGTMIYIFTDGFADQFGGAKGKKFMVRKFYDMLKGMAQQPCIEQHTILMHAIQEWKGMHEQVDDVLVIGVRM
jgi:ligand-binding sensor domain-containing protein/serine phosphatase RsbU (regulator of sigma subunit)